MSWEELELIQLDAHISRAASSWVRWRHQLRSGAGLDAEPFAPFPFVSRLGFEHLRARPESDPLRAPALRWLYRLVDDKACRELIAGAERAYRHETFALDAPERGHFTPAGLLTRTLGDAPRRRVWAEQWLRHSTEHAARVRELWERRQDVARRLGLDGPNDLALPCPDTADVARAWLETTRDAAGEQRRSDLAGVIEVSLGLEASTGWPARLSARTLGALFGETRLLEGYPLSLGPLPAAVAPASFLRGLARLGAALSDAGAPRHQPFVLAHDPFGLRRFTFGALLAALPLSRPFSRRVLGLGSARLTDHERALARVVLLESRRAALRVILRELALRSGAELTQAFEALTEEVLGVPLPRALAGSLVRLHADDAQRFAGLLLAATRIEQLTEEHDEDWYRNPRATEALRADLARPPDCRVTREALDDGARSLSRALASRLG